MLKNLLKVFIIVFLLASLITACKEVNLTGDEIAWSPDGQILAFVNIQTGGIYLSATNFPEKFTRIDSNAYFPQHLQWSADGEYLMYLKSENNQIKLYLWQQSSRVSRFVANIAAKKQGDNLIPVAYPIWKGAQKQILFVGQAQGGVLALREFSVLKKRVREIWKQKCDMILPAYVPEKEKIFFGVKSVAMKSLNGIWSSDRHAPRMVFSDADLIEFRISPDGQQMAIVTSNEKFGTKGIKILFSDLNFERIKVAFEADEEISQIAWSLDGAKLAAVVAENDEKNIFVINAMTHASKKLTFDNLTEFYGWGSEDDLIYAIKFPESFVELSGPRKDEKEFREIALGKEIRHQLVSYKGKRFERLGQNIAAYQKNPLSASVAYYQIKKINSLGEDIYLMTVRDSSGFLYYYPDEKSEFLLAAEARLSKYENNSALDNLAKYWGFDLRRTKFSKQFNKLLSDDEPDSSLTNQLTEAISDGALAQTYLSLQQAGLKEKADDVCQTLALFSQKYLPQHEEKYDELTWGIITIFSRLNHFDEGIKFVEELMSIADYDSLAKSYFYFIEGIFSYQKGNLNDFMKRLVLSAKFLPAEKDEIEPYNAFISICLSRESNIPTETVAELFEILTDKFAYSDNISTTYELMGDFYLKRKDVESALAAYRKSLIKNSDENRVWRKIFDLERRGLN